MLNITTFLDANSKRLDKNVLYNPTTGDKYNSGELLSIVSEIGRNLKEAGVTKGDRVLIYLKNSEEYLLSLFAVWRIGAIAIPTNRIMTVSELEYIISDSQATLMITDDEAPSIEISTMKHHQLKSAHMFHTIFQAIRIVKCFLLKIPIGMTCANYSILQALLENRKEQCLPMEIILLQSTMSVTC